MEGRRRVNTGLNPSYAARRAKGRICASCNSRVSPHLEAKQLMKGVSKVYHTRTHVDAQDRHHEIQHGVNSR